MRITSRPFIFIPALLAPMLYFIPAWSQGWGLQGQQYYGHMGGSGWHGWFFGPLMMIAFIAVAVVVVVLLVRWLGGASHGSMAHKQPDKTPLDILKERFARGEIDKEEFEERRKILRD